MYFVTHVHNKNIILDTLNEVYQEKYKINVWWCYITAAYMQFMLTEDDDDGDGGGVWYFKFFRSEMLRQDGYKMRNNYYLKEFILGNLNSGR